MSISNIRIEITDEMIARSFISIMDKELKRIALGLKYAKHTKRRAKLIKKQQLFLQFKQEKEKALKGLNTSNGN